MPGGVQCLDVGGVVVVPGSGVVVLLALTPSLASAAGSVRIQRAYVNLSDHLLYLDFCVKLGVLGWALIYLDEELWDIIPTKAHLNPPKPPDVRCRHGGHGRGL